MVKYNKSVISILGSKTQFEWSSHNVQVSPLHNPLLKKWRDFSWVVTDVVQWPNTNSLRLSATIPDGGSLRKWEIPLIKDDSLYMQCVYMRECLSLWEESFSDKGIMLPAIEAARRVLLYGPEYAEYISDLVKFSLRANTGYMYEPSDDDLYDPDAWGEDYFPCTRGFINWKIPDSIDYNLLFAEPKHISEDKINLFKEYVDHFTTGDRNWTPEFDSIDALNCLGSNRTYVDGKPGSTSNIDLRRTNKKFKLAETLKLKISQVQKNQTELRCAVVSEEKSLPRVKLFHRMFKAVNCCPEDKYYDPDVLKGLENYLTSKTWRECYIMQDLKKSGLTINRLLYNAVMEVLHTKFPKMGWDYWFDYAGCEIFVNGEYKKCTNGCGLGLMDCVVSFIQAVLYNMYMDEHPLPEGVTADAKFWSDDSVVKIRLSKDFPNNEVLELVQEQFENINLYMTDFGMTMHSSKPYMSYHGVFLEYYSTDEEWCSDKVGQYMCAALSTILATDIAAAKDHFSSVIQSATEEVEPYISLLEYAVTNYWGYEFDPIETSLPYELGGWVYEEKSGYNNLIPSVLDTPDSVLVKFSGFIKWHLKNMRKPPKVRMTKELQTHIDNIIEAGWSQDPREHGWSECVKTSLTNKVMKTAENIRFRKSIIQKRASAFKTKACKIKENPMSVFHEFSRTCSTWYMRMPQDLEVSYPVAEDLEPEKVAISDTNRAFNELTNRLGLSELVISGPLLASASNDMLAYTFLKKYFYKESLSRDELVSSLQYDTNMQNYAEASVLAYGFCGYPKASEGKSFDELLTLIYGAEYKFYALNPRGTGIIPCSQDPNGYPYEAGPDYKYWSLMANYLCVKEEFKEYFSTIPEGTKYLYILDYENQPEEEWAFDPDRPTPLAKTEEILLQEEYLLYMVTGLGNQQRLQSLRHAGYDVQLEFVNQDSDGPPYEAELPNLGGMFDDEDDY
jgi:hypothetical protein